jgi:ClpP class serine protease
MTAPKTGKGKSPATPDTSPRALSKTPMFTATNAGRYQRQELIKEINRREETELICYVGGPRTEIDRNDVIGFVDLLHNVRQNTPIDLLVHTFGGDVDACEKLIALIHAKAVDSPFRVIVPDVAKSAGTFMALGANAILMSDSSELGMIDPQFSMKDSQGNRFSHSVTAYLEAFQEHVTALRKDPKDPVALLMLDGFDPKVVRKFQGIRDRVRSFAEDLLKRRGAPASGIVGELMSAARWKTHGQPIKHADAKQFGLPVEYLAPDSERWLSYWRLYCLQKLEVADDKKIFESSYVSQTFQ